VGLVGILGDVGEVNSATLRERRLQVYRERGRLDVGGNVDGLDSISSSGITKKDSTNTESSSMMVDVGSGSYQISTAALTVWRDV
jgi:hypothetical protein